MLPREYRLTKKKDFENVFKKGKTLKEEFLLLKIAKNNSKKVRFGFIVSQKISKKATIRNKIKRKISELIRQNIKRFKKGIDGIIITLPGIEKQDFKKGKETLEKIFKKAGILG